MPVTSAVPGHVEQEGDHQDQPFVAHDASLEHQEIRQRGPGQEDGASQRPEPGRQRRHARQDEGLKGRTAHRRVRQPPDQNANPRNEHQKQGGNTTHGLLLRLST